jgi:peroxiredoxin (alkyl hydroperoxide reductase subunit C)
LSVLVTKEAPDFIASAVLADGSIVQDFQLSKFKGQKIVIFFYPLNFTFVCPSEILAHHHRVNAFKDRDTVLIGISIDSTHTHNAWRNTKINDGGIEIIDFPLVSDMNHSIMNAYGIIHPEGTALRASFLIDENFIIRHQVVNDHPLGRNVDEMLRMVDALDFHTSHGEVCPAGWNKGDEGIKENADGIAEYLSKNVSNL